MVKPWTTALEVDELCAKMCKDHWVLAWFKWVYRFPAHICISVNDVVVHGVPRKWMVFKDWDVVKFDFWVKDKKVWVNTDSAFTMIVWDWPHDPEIVRFLEANKKWLYAWIEKARVWNRIWDISHAIQQAVEAEWFYIVKDLTWHGIWKLLHEKPYVYNYWKPWSWPLIKKWMTLAIEPIIWFSTWKIIDKWDFELYMADWWLWAQFEHTILITDWEPEIII
jgi:methionyl aminopeptidase